MFNACQSEQYHRYKRDLRVGRRRKLGLMEAQRTEFDNAGLMEAQRTEFDNATSLLMVLLLLVVVMMTDAGLAISLHVNIYIQ